MAWPLSHFLAHPPFPSPQVVIPVIILGQGTGTAGEVVGVLRTALYFCYFRSFYPFCGMDSSGIW